MQSIYDASENQDDDDNESLSEFEELQLLRIQTAPARPITELEEFKRSSEFILMESAFICQSRLIQKEFHKYDLDSLDGQRVCKKYLNLVEKLCESFSVQVASRDYRNDFSVAYKILYKQDRLCYLTEILDSAQEGFPYLWVNGQKYVFSNQVLEAGAQLIESFCRVQHVIRHAYSLACQDTAEFSKNYVQDELKIILEQFDTVWVTFEKQYVVQLMYIESEARKYITQAIEIDKELTSTEIREKIRGKILVSEEVTNLKKKLCKCMAQINSVANLEGKGRDDLISDILLESEGIIRRVTREQSRAVRFLAEAIKKNFQKFRELLKKYEENIEMVDPQLKNNIDLVEVLQQYETYWEKGANYFLNQDKCSQLILFSHIIETTSEKHQIFLQQIEERDSDIFITIPQILVMKNLEGDDKNICFHFLPPMLEEGSKQNTLYQELKRNFEDWRKTHAQSYQYHNILEKMLLGIDLNEIEKASVIHFEQKLDAIVYKIKLLAIELQRFNANEWNQFIDAAINNDY